MKIIVDSSTADRGNGRETLMVKRMGPGVMTRVVDDRVSVSE